MSRTKRRQWVPDREGGFVDLHLSVGREKTCKPGCGVCGKPEKRARRRRQRHDQRRAVTEELDA